MKVAVVGATGQVGRVLVALLRTAAHEIVEVSRARGMDVTTGKGLEDAFAGADRVIDVSNSPTTKEAGATAFFSGCGAHTASCKEKRRQVYRAAVDHRRGSRIARILCSESCSRSTRPN